MELNYPFYSVVAVFKMLVCILNTLRRRIWDISFFLFSDKNIDSIWCQRTEKQNFYIESNVMSEQIKMPGRHFLCRDYLHIGFYIKVLLFVCLALQIYIYCFYLFYCFFFEILFLYFVNIRKFFDRRYSETTKKFFCRSKYNGMSYCIESSQFFY